MSRILITATLPSATWQSGLTVDHTKVKLRPTKGFGAISSASNTVGSVGSVATVTFNVRGIDPTEVIIAECQLGWLVDSAGNQALPTTIQMGANNTTTPLITMIGLSYGVTTYNFATPVAAKHYLNPGVMYVPAGTTVVSKDPPDTATLGGYKINGGERNPLRRSAEQGFDQRAQTVANGGIGRNGDLYNPARRAEFPITFGENESYLGVISNPNPAADLGGDSTHDVWPAEFTAIYSSVTPPAGAYPLAPAIIGFAPGDTRPSMQLTAAPATTVAAMPNLAISGHQLPADLNDIARRVSLFNPAPALFFNAESVRRWVGDITTEDGYGEMMMRRYGEAHLIQSYAIDVGIKERLMVGAVANGSQWYQTIVNFSGTRIPPDGMTNSGRLTNIAQALARCGMGDEMRTLREDVGCNEITQPFIYTALHLERCTLPHSVANGTGYPDLTRRMQITGVSGNVLTFASPISYFIRADARIVRESDGASAVLTAGYGGFTLTVNAQPSPAFAIGDWIYCRPNFTPVVGVTVDWSLRYPLTESHTRPYDPTQYAGYRIQFRAADVAFALKAQSMCPPEWDALPAYVVAAATGTNSWPTVYNTPSLLGSQFYATHWPGVAGNAFAF